MSKTMSELSSMLTVGLILITAVVWRWQADVFRAPRDEVKRESWEGVKDTYPMPKESADSPQLSSDLAESVVRANPFSPKRRLVPAAAGGPSGSETASKPAAPRFLYKGRINLGQRQRAIVEETTAHKTYFLEVGQEVAGCKVLDIAENRVVLSDSQTKQEIVVSLAAPESS